MIKPKRARARTRLQLLALAAVFAAPIVAACVLYFSGWRPDNVRPHGDLVTPARRVEDVELKRLDNNPVRFSSLQRQWLLIYFDSSECTSACERALYTMRQVIAAQGREAHRVVSIMVITDTHALDMLRYQLKDYPDVTALTGTPTELARLAREFGTPDGGALSRLHRIYVVDPLGNFVMSYPPQVDPSGLRKDLQRLLRYSQVG